MKNKYVGTGELINNEIIEENPDSYTLHPPSLNLFTKAIHFILQYNTYQVGMSRRFNPISGVNQP